MKRGPFVSSGVAAIVCLGAAVAVSCKSGSAPSSATAGACGASLNTKPTAAAWVAPADASQPVSASFTLSIDTTNAVLTGEWLQPHPEALTIAGGGSGLHMVGGVKPFFLYPHRYLVELNLVNDQAPGLAGVTVAPSALAGATAFYDLNADPFAAASTPEPMALGGIGPQGVSAHLRFGVDLDPSATTITLTLAVSAVTTSRVSTTSAPLAVTPDGAEVWAPFGDADTLSVIDTATDARVAQVATAGHPSSVAVTPDGKLVLVACSACNQLSVIDRASRAVVQTFGEADGVGRDPRDVVVSPDGTQAFVSAYVGDTVTAFQRVGDSFREVATIPVGRRPLGMSMTPDGKTLYVAHFLPRNVMPDNEGWVSVVATSSLSVASEAILRDDADANEASCLSQISAFSGDTGDDLKFEAVPTQLSGVFLNPGGSEGWVPGLRLAGFPIFEGDVANAGITSAVVGANSPSMNFPLDTRDPQHAAFRKTPLVVDFTDRAESFLACVPGTEDAEGVLATPTDANERTFVGVTIPSESTMLSETGVVRFVAYSKGGRRGLFVSYNADELAVFDGATHNPLSLSHFLLQGSNPTGLVFTPDGNKAYVAYENSAFVSVLDTSAFGDDANLPAPQRVPYRLLPGSPTTGATIITFAQLTRDTTGIPDQPPITETRQVALAGADPMTAKMRRGKVLFTSSNPIKYRALTSIRESSCSSCHPNGGNDGSAWSTMEGERRTIGLWGGTATRGWLHASATHASSYDFATTIVRDRFGGTGLSDADADALASYVAFGIPKLQSPPVNAALAATGKALFAQKCASCHGDDGLGSGHPAAGSPYGNGDPAGPGLFDVGSATDWAGVTLGVPYTNLFAPATKAVLNDLRGDRALGSADPVQQTLDFTPRPDRARGAFKAPPLTNVWENAVFFHDGRVASLADAVNDIAPRIGATLAPADVDALVAYLTTL
jgi:YVTN family beta-propeller protein